MAAWNASRAFLDILLGDVASVFQDAEEGTQNLPHAVVLMEVRPHQQLVSGPRRAPKDPEVLVQAAQVVDDHVQVLNHLVRFGGPREIEERDVNLGLKPPELDLSGRNRKPVAFHAGDHQRPKFLQILQVFRRERNVRDRCVVEATHSNTFRAAANR
jgi:hypothetical protein